MDALLVRVGADLSPGGGSWNAPVDSQSNEFVYVPIPENNQVHAGMEKPYRDLAPTLEKFGVTLPSHLRMRHMHLDPDFSHLTYGDQGERAKQLRTLREDDWIIFYAGLADVRTGMKLVYAIIGLLVIKEFVLARDVSSLDYDLNAHSRRVLAPGATDLVIRGQPLVSGRLKYCIPIGEYRNRAYRVRGELLQEWGGLSLNDGYLQRSARLSRILEPIRFQRWFEKQQPILIQRNN